jgi:ribosome biogenesis protein MAK21
VKKLSWVHRQNAGLSIKKYIFHVYLLFSTVHRTHSSTRYDGYARNALFANADSTLEYELTLLAIHYHPTVAIFAKNILTVFVIIGYYFYIDNLFKNIPIRYDGDPLLDFTLMRFLDRFVYRNPKSIPPNVDKGTNVIKRAVRRKVYNPLGVKKLAVTSEEYRQKNICEVPPDEQFLHRYVTSIGITKKKSKKSADGANSDIESVNSDEFEEMLGL